MEEIRTDATMDTEAIEAPQQYWRTNTRWIGTSWRIRL